MAAKATEKTKAQDEPTGSDLASTKDATGRTDAVGYVDEPGLTDHEIVRRKTSGDGWPLDGRYRRVFGIQVPRVSVGTVELDWNAPEHEAMHEANKVQILQEALNKGLHPTGPARFDEGTEDGALTYSVPVIPASSDPELAAATYTPSAALADLGGSTLPDFTDGVDERK